MKHYYAESDSFTGDYPQDYTHGFANTKTAIAFETYKEREAWLKETKLLTARKLTRREALKLAERIPWEGWRIRFCGCEQDYVLVKEFTY